MEGAGRHSLFDHWSPWPHLKGLNLSVDLLKDFVEEGVTRVDVVWELARLWGCCGESDGGVFPLEWRCRGVICLEGVWIYTCAHAQVCANLRYGTSCKLLLCFWLLNHRNFKLGKFRHQSLLRPTSPTRREFQIVFVVYYQAQTCLLCTVFVVQFPVKLICIT